MKDSTGKDECDTSIHHIGVFNSPESLDSIVVLIHLLFTTFPEDVSSWKPDQRLSTKDTKWLKLIL